MFRISKLLVIFFFIFFSSSTNISAHVQHYDQLNLIEFDIYRNNNFVGTHTFSFNRSGGKLSVKSEIKFEIKKLGIVVYRYFAEGTEIFEDGKLIKFNSTTNQNKKEKYVNMKLENDKYIIEGSSYNGDAPLDYILGTWWNHSIIKAKAQISAVSGRIIEQNVEFLGKEKININGKTYNTLHFNFTSSDKKLAKKKRLNTHVWYEEETFNWVKASFDKSGKWEYRLKTIE